MQKHQIQAKLRALVNEGSQIYTAAADASLRLTTGEQTRLADIEDQIATLEPKVRGAAFNEQVDKLQEMPLACEVPLGDGDPNEGRSNGGELEKRSWAELTRRTGGSSLSGWGDFDDAGDYLKAVLSQRFDPRLKALESRDMGSTPDEDGGFALPGPLADEILSPVLGQSIVMSRARIFPMTSRTLRVPSWLDGDRSANLYGGLVTQWVAENSAFDFQQPKLQAVNFESKKLGILTAVSSEMAQDSQQFMAHLTTALREAATYVFDEALLTGNGSPGPEGVLSSPALVTVAKESGQAANTVLFENVVNMWARMSPGGHERCVWVVAPSVIPMLLTMTLGIGTAGMLQAAQQTAAGGLTLLGRPVITSDKLPNLGQPGDILLADFRQYGVGLRASARIEVDSSARFERDQLLVRLKLRADGKSLISSPITPRNGGDTLSPFVVLAERA